MGRRDPEVPGGGGMRSQGENLSVTQGAHGQWDRSGEGTNDEQGGEASLALCPDFLMCR